MATLTNTPIDQTYVGLIKLDDNGAIDPTVLKGLTDGTGGSMNISVSQVETKFTAGSLVDFTGVTVNGLPPAAAGLESGTGSDSMQSAASLTANPASAGNTRDIALGDGCFTNGGSDNIMIGGAGQASDQSIAIGVSSVAINTSIALHANARATGSRCISIGRATDVSGEQAVGIGGEGSTVSGAFAVGVGSGISITGQQSGGFGYQTAANASGAFAIGNQVNAQKANTVSIQELEVQTVGGGIIMYSPNGTEYKLTVSDAGALVIS